MGNTDTLQKGRKSHRRVALYARVSTDSQEVENQLRELRQAIARHGWELAGEYVDRGISGAKGRDRRAQFDRLLKDGIRREFDVIAAWSVDRLGRSLRDLVAFLEEIQAAGVDLYLHQQGLDTTTPAGKALFGMCGVFAEFERSMIVERVKTGIARARKQGTKSGRAFGRPRVPESTERNVRALRAKGRGILAIAKELGIGTSTVQRILGA